MPCRSFGQIKRLGKISEPFYFGGPAGIEPMACKGSLMLSVFLKIYGSFFGNTPRNTPNLIG